MADGARCSRALILGASMISSALVFSDAGLARAFAAVQDSSGPASESLRRTNPRDSGEQLAGYGDLVARRCWQKIILRRLVRAGAADDGGPGSARVAEGLIWE